MTPGRYRELRNAIIAAGYAGDIEWSEAVKPAANADDFANEAIYVILCSGMKAQVAQIIQRRVWAAIDAGKPVKGNVLGNSGKAGAIDTIWQSREALFAAFKRANDPVEFCLTLPWIGNITKWHLAKNLGVDCAKPDVHLVRVATHYGTTPAALCADLAAATGDRIATVDLVIWRACNLGILRSREMSPTIRTGAPGHE
jgi:hypothetical protein